MDNPLASRKKIPPLHHRMKNVRWRVLRREESYCTLLAELVLKIFGFLLSQDHFFWVGKVFLPSCFSLSWTVGEGVVDSS
jgi:hypothetical protein